VFQLISQCQWETH